MKNKSRQKDNLTEQVGAEENKINNKSKLIELNTNCCHLTNTFLRVPVTHVQTVQFLTIKYSKIILAVPSKLNISPNRLGIILLTHLCDYRPRPTAFPECFHMHTT